jgi:hypothetical protein
MAMGSLEWVQRVAQRHPVFAVGLSAQLTQKHPVSWLLADDVTHRLCAYP